MIEGRASFAGFLASQHDSPESGAMRMDSIRGDTRVADAAGPKGGAVLPVGFRKIVCRAVRHDGGR